MKNFLWIISGIILLSACGDDNSTEADLCFQFDERSCQTDLWMTGVDVPTDLDDRISIMEGYFRNEGLDVVEIKVDTFFHEVVCQACDVCPAGPRIFIAANGVTQEELSTFRLLNLATMNCESF